MTRALKAKILGDDEMPILVVWLAGGGGRQIDFIDIDHARNTINIDPYHDCGSR
jgi:hypothetical protein